MLKQSFPSDNQPLLEVRATLTLSFQGRVVFRNFALTSEFGTCTMFDHRGHFTVKQLRLSLVKQIRTNSYTGP